MKRSLAVLIILFGGGQWSFCQNDSKDPYAEKLISYLVSDKGPVFSMQTKAVSRLGDGAAVGLIRHIGSQMPATSHEIERTLFVVKMAFASPDSISFDADREPKATWLLLSYLSFLPASSNLKGEIEHTRTYVQQQIDDYKAKHAKEKN